MALADSSQCPDNGHSVPLVLLLIAIHNGHKNAHYFIPFLFTEFAQNLFTKLGQGLGKWLTVWVGFICQVPSKTWNSCRPNLHQGVPCCLGSPAVYVPITTVHSSDKVTQLFDSLLSRRPHLTQHHRDILPDIAIFVT